MTDTAGERHASASDVSKRKAAAAARRAQRTPKLTVADWVDAAMSVLLTDGVGAISIPRLCEHLGVTKGSFYWHFDDLEHLLEATADHWCAAQNDSVRGLHGLEALPPDQRLQRMGELLAGDELLKVEYAVRDWARTSPKVFDAVKSLDQRIFAVLEQTLTELGFTPAEARMRAAILSFIGIGFVHGRDTLPTPTSEQIRATFDFITGK
ncbi:TetR/AcrR family transcriptional regulator [Nocardia sp. NPDC005366]|uniref:TetR/AcrR family transcriptional regulator n=1 Tax=Nocardia sp. NPDC005366 TaxID=3156878 RepID=UPI0033B52714